MIGEGLDQVSDSPISANAVGDLQQMEHDLMMLDHRLARLQIEMAGADEEWLADLAYCQQKANRSYQLVRSIISGDHARAAQQRHELRARIQEMVERIAAHDQVEGREIHTAYMRAMGYKPQSEMSVEELKQKVNWLMETYKDLFPVDGREWLPPGYTGMEPGKITKQRRAKHE